MIYVLELEWRGEKAVLVIEIALQNIFFGCILFNFSRCIFITLCVRVGRCLNSHVKLEKSVTVQSQLSFSKWFKRKGFFFPDEVAHSWRDIWKFLCLELLLKCLERMMQRLLGEGRRGCMGSWKENRFHSDSSDFIAWQLVSFPPGLI